MYKINALYKRTLSSLYRASADRERTGSSTNPGCRPLPSVATLLPGGPFRSDRFGRHPARSRPRVRPLLGRVPLRRDSPSEAAPYRRRLPGGAAPAPRLTRGCAGAERRGAAEPWARAARGGSGGSPSPRPAPSGAARRRAAPRRSRRRSCCRRCGRERGEGPGRRGGGGRAGAVERGAVGRGRRGLGAARRRPADGPEPPECPGLGRPPPPPPPGPVPHAAREGGPALPVLRALPCARLLSVCLSGRPACCGHRDAVLGVAGVSRSSTTH